MLQEGGVEVVVALLRHCHTPTPASLAALGEPRPLLTHEVGVGWGDWGDGAWPLLIHTVSTLPPQVLEMLCALLTHRRFAELFVEQGGAQHLLMLPR